MDKNLNTLKDYQQRLPHYRNLLTMMESVYRLRQDTGRARERNIYPGNRAEAVERLRNGKSIVNPLKDAIADNHAKERFLSLLSLLEPLGGIDAEGLLKASAMAAQDGYEKMVRDLFTGEISGSGEDAGSGDGGVFNILPFLLHESLKPYFSSLAGDFSTETATADWSQSFCPVCSRPADMAIIRDDGRHLFCLQCDCEWHFKRLQCPVCGNTSTEDLAFFTVENGDGGNDDDPYRVDVCHRCHGYIKTIDARKKEGLLIPELENIITIHLDLRAEAEGFQRTGKTNAKSNV